MKFVKATGGREKYFKTERAGDCVTRAICNATGKDYLEVYNALNELAKKERIGKRKRSISNARTGVYRSTYGKYLESLGYTFTPLKSIGSGCRVHLCSEELPSKGTYIVKCSKHLTCVKDGVLYDTYDGSRDGTRCVYGYWRVA